MKKILFIIGIVVAFAACAKIENESIVDKTTITASVDMDVYPVTIKANGDYTINTNCDWVIVDSKVTENNCDKVTFKCLMNPTAKKRATSVEINGEHFYQYINIIQPGRDKKYIKQTGDSLFVFLTEPGTLYQTYKNDDSKEYGEEVWGDVVKITIGGTVDARDFSTLKWNFRNLQYLDISGVTIYGYRGEYGTNEGYYDGTAYSIYNANEIPIGAFFYWENNDIREFPKEFYDEGMPSLRKIKLPDGIKTIRRNAFARAYNLTEINIPEGVETVDMVAFRYCMSIEKLYLPSTLKNIGWLAFTEMSMLKEVHIAAKEKPEEDTYHDGEERSFGNRLDASQVEGIIGEILRGWVINIDGMEPYNPKTNATLYVPKGCKNNYKKWEKHFQDIVEE